ncbi:hypothetical protein BU17DRAFT_78704 [Hysterangium stoloniferum]|nr:hypothetical protein BU17DRAFT_78704 [Hysterangium stoloniferum]
MADELEELYPSFTFVLFSLNPKATVAPLRDEEAMAATEGITRKQYLGMVTQASYLPHPEGGLLTTLGVRVVSRKHPKSLPLPKMNENSFIPISPASHPLGRQPVQPNAILPWDSCFFHCRPAINFVPTSVDRENAKFVSIAEEDEDYLVETIGADMDDREERWRAAVQSGEAPQMLKQCGTESISADFLTTYKQDMENGGYDSEDDEQEESISLEEQLLLNRLEYTRFSHFEAIDISYNLSASSEIGDLDDLLLQLDQISRIIDDSTNRATSRLQEIAKSKAQDLPWVKDANAALGVDDDAASIADKPVISNENTKGVPTNFKKGSWSEPWRFRKPRFIRSTSKFKATTVSLKISSLIFGCFGSGVSLTEKAVI